MLEVAELVIGMRETRSAFVTYTYSDVLLFTQLLAMMKYFSNPASIVQSDTELMYQQ